MTTAPLPLVSLCVPTYNSASYLRETLDSLLAQTYQNIEIIVSDNASTDETPAILEEYARLHGICVMLNDANVGAGGNFNRLVAAARGEFTTIYHGDDIYEPTIVEESVRALLADETMGLVGTMAKAIDSKGAYLFSYSLPQGVVMRDGASFTFDEVMHGVLKTLGRRIFFITPSIMVRSRLYRELGGFDQKKFKSAVDYEMWLRIAAGNSVAVIDRPLMLYRLHDQQGSEHEVRRNPELPDVYFVIRQYRHIIQGARTKKLCETTLDRTLIKTALKQNYVGRFVQSSEIMTCMQTLYYRLAGLPLRIANFMRINCRLWP